jgi:glutathione S-transferase
MSLFPSEEKCTHSPTTSTSCASASFESNMIDFQLSATVTVVFMLHYLLFDVLGVVPLRVKYGVPYPKTTGPEPFERAFRTQQNQVEQMTPFLALLWVCSIFFNPSFAGSVGAIWVVCRMAYSFLYRLGTSSRRILIITTIPAYLCLAVLAFGALFGIVRRQTGREELAWAVITLLVPIYAMLTIAHRRLLGRPSRESPPSTSPGGHLASAK